MVLNKSPQESFHYRATPHFSILKNTIIILLCSLSIVRGGEARKKRKKKLYKKKKEKEKKGHVRRIYRENNN